ncbi:MAG: GerMN domain-containing protein [Lachnospiraceae bacterium]
MKKMRTILMGPLILLLVLLSSGCSEEEDTGTYKVNYLNKDMTKIVSRGYTPQAEDGDTDALVKELLDIMSTDSGDIEYKRAIPSTVDLNSYELEENGTLTLFFGQNYYTMNSTTEVLSRAAIVRTLSQVEGIEGLQFYAGDQPLNDQSGLPVGIMTRDSFIENPGKQINTIQQTELVLYFADLEGSGLVEERQDVHYSSNISLEKLVMEHLLEGPQGDIGQSAIPAGTKILSINVQDGVCYVGLDKTFINNQNYEIEEGVVIYSIVNSLCELPSISKVQISVNGDTDLMYREKFSLNELYISDPSYIKSIESATIKIDDVEVTDLNDSE